MAKTFQYSAVQIGVDSSQVAFADSSLIRPNIGVWQQTFERRLVPPGTYEISWLFRVERISGHGTIEIPSGQLVIGDPCYFLTPEKLLEMTKRFEEAMKFPPNPPKLDYPPIYLDETRKGLLECNLDHDGEYVVKISLVQK